MTDARFPERWLNDRRILRLSDAAFRMFVISLAWSVANRTDGWLTLDDLALIPGCSNDKAAAELYDAELWWNHFDHAQIAEFEETQTTSADLAHLAEARRKQREKKRRQRANLALVPRDVPRDSTRTGQARTGSTKNEVQVLAPPPSKPDGDGSNPVVHDDQHEPGEGPAGASVRTVTRGSGDDNGPVWESEFAAWRAQRHQGSQQ
jgi:hypothetical protein